ncbi:transcription factor Nrm1/Whi5 [Pseudohyphozyma bogoriensis]|nr:transcription factor Nrm1/Whi5 [Pseudohyphozyma bogoriensis]
MATTTLLSPQPFATGSHSIPAGVPRSPLAGAGSAGPGLASGPTSPAALPQPSLANTSTPATPAPAPTPSSAAEGEPLAVVTNGTGGAREGEDAAPASASATPADDGADKGKRKRSDEEKRDMVEKVLKRAESSKLTRAFKTRLALAAFKAERGWHEVKFDVIEPHLEEEEALRQQQKELAMRQSQSQQGAYQEEGAMGPPPSASGLKRSRGGSVANAAMANATMYEQQQQQSQPAYHAYPPDDVYASPYGPPGAHPQYQPQHQPTASTSSLQPPVHLQANGLHAPLAPPAPGFPDAHRSKRRMTNPSQEGRPPFLQQQGITDDRRASVSSSTASGPSLHHSHSQNPSPRMRNSATRSSIYRSPPPPLPNGNSSAGPSTSTGAGAGTSASGQPLSTSDPTFSSFVDAASVLSGLSRGPSDPSVVSEDGSNPGGPSTTTDLARPVTPERPNKGKAVANGAGGPENDTAGAAELMLFLAASPSPAQNRSGAASRSDFGLGVGGGEGGMGMMKGRRLFSDSAPSESLKNTPFDYGPTSAFGDDGLGHGAPPSSLGKAGGGGGGGPSTPRERQPSYGTSGWGDFINMSPQRAAPAQLPFQMTATGGQGAGEGWWN